MSEFLFSGGWSGTSYRSKYGVRTPSLFREAVAPGGVEKPVIRKPLGEVVKPKVDESLPVNAAGVDEDFEVVNDKSLDRVKDNFTPPGGKVGSGGRNRVLSDRNAKYYADPAFGVNQARYRDSLKVDVGKPDLVNTAEGERFSGVWRVVEADALTPSHEWAAEGGFKKRAGHPGNTRDYEGEPGEMVLEFAKDFDYRGVTSRPPIVVTEDGVVLSGNNRTMSRQIAGENGTDRKYVEEVYRVAERSGVGEGELSGFKHPTLVFEIDVPEGGDFDYSLKGMDKWNVSDMKAESRSDFRKKLARMFQDPEMKEPIAKLRKSLARLLAESATGGENLYANASTRVALFDMLLESGVLSKSEEPKYFERGVETKQGMGRVSDTGKEFVESVKEGLVLSPETIRLLDLPGNGNLANVVESQVLDPVIINSATGEYSLGERRQASGEDAVNEAIQVAARWNARDTSGEKKKAKGADEVAEFDDWSGKGMQGNLGEMGAVKDEVVKMLAKSLLFASRVGYSPRQMLGVLNKALEKVGRDVREGQDQLMAAPNPDEMLEISLAGLQLEMMRNSVLSANLKNIERMLGLAELEEVNGEIVRVPMSGDEEEAAKGDLVTYFIQRDGNLQPFAAKWDRMSHGGVDTGTYTKPVQLNAKLTEFIKKLTKSDSGDVVEKGKGKRKGGGGRRKVKSSVEYDESMRLIDAFFDF